MTISNPVHGVDVAEGNYDNQRHASLATITHATSAPPPRKQQPLDIIDIRQNDLELDLRRDIMDMLKPERGPKKLPTLLLYDEKGLQTFEEITYLEEYYVTNAEIDVLEHNADEIARNIQSESMVIELGSGNLRKVSILLNALEAAGKSIHYYALDLSQRELERTLSSMPKFEHVVCHGLLGTYDDGLAWIRDGCDASWPKCIMSLGSSIGNFQRGEAAEFLKGWADILRPSDSMIIGLDAYAYNDSHGITHRFLLNGLENANGILGENVFDTNDWNVIGEYIHDKDGEGTKHITLLNVISLSVACISNKAGSETLWKVAGLKEVGRWKASKEQYNVHILTKLDEHFHLHPMPYAASTVPTLEDWRGL
ncbi:hypothetical protein ACLOAV_008425 [Pseudogymnoascus australis]